VVPIAHEVVTGAVRSPARAASKQWCGKGYPLTGWQPWDLRAPRTREVPCRNPRTAADRTGGMCTCWTEWQAVQRKVWGARPGVKSVSPT
jgi:hypothetical protein